MDQLFGLQHRRNIHPHQGLIPELRSPTRSLSLYGEDANRRFLRLCGSKRAELERQKPLIFCGFWYRGTTRCYF